MGRVTSKGKTPWFDGAVKPARAGVYQRKAMFGPTWSRWDGTAWCIAATSSELADLTTNRSNYQTLPWRGLAKKP